MKAAEKPILKSRDITQTFVVYAAHIEVWADVSAKTAQREMRKIRNHFGLQKRARLTFLEVAEFYGWRKQELLEELNTRRIRVKERLKEKL